MKKIKRKLTARETAAKLCSLGKQTRKTLAEKLRAKKYPYSEIDEAVSAMVEIGYIDEEEYARCFVSDSYRIKKHGRIRILTGLKMKGIESEVAEKAINNFNADEKEIIKSEMEKRFPEKSEKEKIMRYFLSRGFSLSDLRSFVDEE